MKKRKKRLSKKQMVQRRKKINRYLLISLSLLCLILLCVFGYTTYSLWNAASNQNSTNVISSGCFDLEINDLDSNMQSTAINLRNTYPMSDERGTQTKPYVLNINNICDIPSEYTIILNEFDSSTLPNSLIKYQVIKSDMELTMAHLSEANLYNLDYALKQEIEASKGMLINNSYIIASGYLASGEEETYQLRMWLDYNATNDAMNKRFESAISVISTSPQ